MTDAVRSAATDPVIRTPRMVLRPLRREDLPSLVALDADPEVVRHITGGVPTPPAVVEEVLLPRMLAAGGGDPRLGFFAAEDPADGTFLGWFHLRPDTFEPAWLELGYRLRRACWGRGLATEGTLALRAFAAAEWPGRPHSARTVPENAASRRVMEKCGLSYAGTCRFPARAWPGLSLPELDGVVYLSAEGLGSGEGR